MDHPLAQIDRIPDEVALQILQSVTKAAQVAADFPEAVEHKQELLSQMLVVLGSTVEAQPAGRMPNEGEVAKALIKLLAQDERFRLMVAELISAPPIITNAWLGIETPALLVVGSIIALQTYVKVERTQEGKWSFRLERKPASESLIGQALKTIAARFRPF